MGNAVRADDPGPAAENSCIIRASLPEGPIPSRRRRIAISSQLPELAPEAMSLHLVGDQVEGQHREKYGQGRSQ